MSLVEFLVVYLSSGAPFGVLIFFSTGSRLLPVRLLGSVLAAFLWPFVALSWTHRRLLDIKNRADGDLAQNESPPLEFERDPLIWEYFTLTRALGDSRRPSNDRSAELFGIAGHSNPRLAAICAERRRNALLERRQTASAKALETHLCDRTDFDPTYLRSIAAESRRLGDSRTADLIAASIQVRTQALTGGPEVAVDSVQLAA